MRHRLAGTLALALGLARTGCAREAAGPLPAATRGALREAGVRAPEDPTVRGARLLPESLQEAHVWGVEPGGGTRAIVAGVRFISFPDGAILSAGDRLPANPTSVVALPDRLGSGFLFPVANHVWRADTWLGPATPVVTTPFQIAQALVGLDRVYVRSSQGTPVALDPRTGARLDLGPVPASPNLGRLVALDAWRAIAIADLRGALVTLDAGSSWRPIALPIEPSDVVALEGRFAVGGLDASRQVQWWEVQPDGQTGWLDSPPAVGAAPGPGPSPADPLARTFGPRPLIAAVEDGWPLVDGSALVARDGALARVRLSDGALVETVGNAFSLKPARCHPVSLAHPRDRTALAFVCGEPRGQTAIYAWEAASSRLVELRRFREPREVLTFGNGALAARGPCAADAGDQLHEGEQPWCLMLPGGEWTEMHFRGDEVDRARLVVLSDGRAVLVRPPRDGELSTARLTISEGEQSRHLPLSMPALHPDVARALRLGVWMDGFEERRPGVLGGWVDAAGSVVGVEIALDGETRVGEYIRDAGGPVVSGRLAFGWTASRRGFETTDGGMTWTKEIDLPDPIGAPSVGRERACGPVGCLTAGWLRIGWGVRESAPAPPPPPPISFGATRSAPALQLECEPIAGRLPEPNASTARAPPAAGASRALTRPWTTGMPSANVSGPVSTFPVFAGRAGPSIPVNDLGVWREASDGLERPLRGVPLAHLYAWGPKGGEWEQLGRWQVRWQWPWGGWTEARSSANVPAPWPGLEAARRALAGWGTVAPGDDADHALLIARRAPGAPGTEILLLEADRPPVMVQRPGGDPFPEVEGAARIGGRWYLVTAQAPAELSASVIWLLDGSAAHELGRVSRGGFETRPPLHLARRNDGKALGLVVEGQPEIQRGPLLWVSGVDLETGAVGDPQPLAPVDLSDRAVSLCTGDDAGWQLELPYPGAVRLHMGAGWSSSLQGAMARMRLAPERACVERVLGSADAYASSAPETPAGAMRVATGGPARSMEVSLLSARSRFLLRCWRR
jgi:hypothetical protein